jgi:hypothetical protein
MKKTIQALTVAALAVAAFALSGCTSVPGTIMDKTKPLSQDGYTVVGPEVQASEWSVHMFGIDVTDTRGSLSRRLYKSCLAQASGADALIEYTLDVQQFNFWFLSLERYLLVGTPVKSK